MSAPIKKTPHRRTQGKLHKYMQEKPAFEPIPIDLTPTPRERAAIQAILDWERASAKRYWMLGVPDQHLGGE